MGLDSLEVILLGAKAAIEEMASINTQSESVMKRVTDIQKLIEPELFGKEDEDV